MTVPSENADPFDLARFKQAQAPVYKTVRAELRSGTKRTHWMWFVFPQAEGLGRSPMAIRYAIKSVDEAAAYLADPLLGERLRACTHAMLFHHDRTARDILGQPDDVKFFSCMTLFAEIGGGGAFAQALDRYFGGARDPATLAFVARAARSG